MKNTCGNCTKFKECHEEWGTLAGKTSEACEDFDEAIRVLAVRQPWASLIVEGLKTIEVRSRNATPGKVAIYASKTEYPENDRNELHAHFICLHRDHIIPFETSEKARESMSTQCKTTGAILGTAVISDSQRDVSEARWYTARKNHLAPAGYYKEHKTCFWQLINPVKFPEPIPLKKWPAGGPWARVPKSILPEVK